MTSPPKPGAPECGLYIAIGDGFDFVALVDKLRHLFFVTTRSAYEKNMHVMELPGNGDAEEIRGLTGMAQHNGFVAIIRGDAGMAKEFGADGIIVVTPEDIQTARVLLGEDGIIGLRCDDRNLAERGLEQGVDYVALSAQSPDTIAWWATRTDKPCVAEGSVTAQITNNDCGALVRAGAGFIEVSDYILNHPQGVKQGAVDVLYAIDLALEKRQPH